MLSSLVETVLSGANGRVVHADDAERQRVGHQARIDAAIGRAAVVLHLEGEGRLGDGCRRSRRRPA